jgi:hypothetical protein
MQKYLGNKSFDISQVCNKAVYKMSQEEQEYFRVRLTDAYEELKELYETDFVERYGFNPSKSFGIKKGFNLEKLMDVEHRLAQSQFILIDQQLINKAQNNTKYFLASSKSSIQYESKTHSNKYDYFACEIDGQILPIVLVEKIKSFAHPTPTDVFEQKSCHVFLLIRGRIPVYIYRFDINPTGSHPNQLENGQLQTEKKPIAGPHEHIFCEKFGVVFPYGNKFAHADAQHAPEFNGDLEKAKDYVMKKFNFTYEKNHQIEQAFDGQPFFRQDENHILFEPKQQTQTDFVDNFTL